MIAAVLDANVLVSSTLVPTGPPARVRRAVVEGKFRLVTSRPIIDEVCRTLRSERVSRPYRLEPLDVWQMRQFLEHEGDIVALTEIVAGVATHPEDDLILSTAVSAKADYLVTSDRQLLALREYEGVKIVTPNDFLSVLRDQGRDE